MKTEKKLHSRLPTKGREHLFSLYVDASFKRAWTKFALEGWADAMKEMRRTALGTRKEDRELGEEIRTVPRCR